LGIGLFIINIAVYKISIAPTRQEVKALKQAFKEHADESRLRGAQTEDTKNMVAELRGLLTALSLNNNRGIK